jgi:signal transduction histidine kinase
VNQLLISSRLYIGVARNNPETQNEMLDKATSYLLMAVDEIRALSKRMNSKVVSSVGLFESIHEIANNMKELNNIDVEVDVDREVATALPAAQQLMVFRIVQEQTGNIVKHSGATSVQILLKQKENDIHLLISDNGKGFDKDEKKVKGIGFINIFNRVDAYNGKVDVITAPGNGCLLDIIFPISNQ